MDISWQPSARQHAPGEPPGAKEPWRGGWEAALQGRHLVVQLQGGNLVVQLQGGQSVVQWTGSRRSLTVFRVRARCV